MSSQATTPSMSVLPVAQLYRESGYLRWKESVLLRLYTLDLAHVLFEEERPVGEKQWRDDALCCGHLLTTLSERLLPSYAHLATARAVWRAVALAYDLDMTVLVSRNKACAFRYDEGKPLVDQLALLQAIATVGENLGCMALYIRNSGFPSEVVRKVDKLGPNMHMDEIWKIAREQVVLDKVREINDSPSLKRGRRLGE